MIFNSKKKELEERSHIMKDFKKNQQVLEEEIRDKSTVLLNLYQYESQKIRWYSPSFLSING